jgi:hypothetical protein
VALLDKDERELDDECEIEGLRVSPTLFVRHSSNVNTPVFF